MDEKQSFYFVNHTELMLFFFFLSGFISVQL